MRWLAGAVVAAALCGLVGGTAMGAEPIKIGALFALTGSASHIGKPSKLVAEMVVDRINKAGGINGRPVELIVLDTQSNPQEALNALMRLIKKEQVAAVVGPTTTGGCMKCLATIEENKVPTVACVGGTPPVEPARPYVFKSPQKTVTAVERVYAYCKKRGWTKVGIITATDAFGQEGKESLEAAAGRFGIAVVGAQSFGREDLDMTVQLGKLGGTDAQAIICWTIGPAAATVAKNVKQLGITKPLLQCHGLPDPVYLELAGEAAEGTIMPSTKLMVADQLPDSDPQKQLLLDFIHEYETVRKYGKVGTHSGYAWDAVQILAQAMAKAGTEPEALRSAIEQTKGYVGVSGVYTMSPTDHCGLGTDSLVMIAVEKGQWKLLE